MAMEEMELGYDVPVPPAMLEAGVPQTQTQLTLPPVKRGHERPPKNKDGAPQPKCMMWERERQDFM